MATRDKRFVNWKTGLLGMTCLFVVGAFACRADDPKGLEFFEKKVRPVLVTHCFSCHSTEAKKIKGGLRLDSRHAVLKGGDNGPAVVPGEAEKSRLLDAIRYENVELQMPPKGKLPDSAITDLTAWVRMGAPWPAEPPSNAHSSKTFNIEERRRSHWAWQPLRLTDPPAVRDTSWPRDSVDRFILAPLESKGLTPAGPADRRTLIRRITFDLIGLPPTPGDVERFVNDRSPDAVEKVVDRLLALPQFGERWARHWLDLVRYGDGRGHEFDFTIPNAYQYRDYVVRAINEDVPYNQFVMEHLAGDLIGKPRLHPTAAFNESILGTGFWFLGEGVHSPVDLRQDEADRFDNMIDVMSKTFLGLTVSCARCHDHKFDAISTKDYYALYGFLKSSSYRLLRFDTLEQHRRIALELERTRKQTAPSIRRAFAESVRPGIGRTAEYLLAARELLLQAPFEGRKFRRTLVRWDRDLLHEIARARKLDVETLARWADAVRAAGESTDVLYPWGLLCRPTTNGNRSTTLQCVTEHPREAEAAPFPGEIIVDYGNPQPSQWMPDEFAWGPRPVQPGTLRIVPSKRGMSFSFVERGAAEIDPVWNSAKLAPGVEGDPTGFGGIVRAGRTIRTPSFTVGPSGRVHFLVKGAGRAYIAVGSYVLFDGPLHKNLLQPIKAGPHFQWITSNDLSAYTNQRAHIELTAAENSDFAIAMVVQGGTSPRAALNENGGSTIFAADVDSTESTAAAYQRAFADIADGIARDKVKGSAKAARIANWMIGHRDLFIPSTALSEFEESVGRIAGRLSQLADELQRPSQLAPVMWDGSGIDENVFVRGSHKAPGEKVPRRFLEALAGTGGLHTESGSGRLELARQMTDPHLNPLIGRVIVNRVWHHLFGRGIVASVDDFGVMGEAPTHPELLDYLANRFMADGWSVKKLIHELVLSRTYQMSCEPSAANDRIDAPNHYLHRMRVRRLEAETIRDAILVVAGQLEQRLYGKSVPVHLTDFQQGRGRPTTSGPLDGEGRRSLYLRVPRNFQTPMLLAFDSPTPFSTMGKRSVSNVPAQALILMNDPFIHQQAERWAKRVLEECSTTDERISTLYRNALSRLPTAEELSKCRAFIESRGRIDSASEVEAWADLGHVLLNTKEFIFVN